MFVGIPSERQNSNLKIKLIIIILTLQNLAFHNKDLFHLQRQCIDQQLQVFHGGPTGIHSHRHLNDLDAEEPFQENSNGPNFVVEAVIFNEYLDIFSSFCHQCSFGVKAIQIKC